MRFNLSLFTIAIALIFILGGNPALSQTCGGPPPVVTDLELSDGRIFEATCYNSNPDRIYMTLIGEGHYLTVEFNSPHHDWAQLKLVNDENGRWGNGQSISMDNGWNGPSETIYEDLSTLGPDYRNEWTYFRELCGVLLDTTGFWQLLKDFDESKVEIVRNTLTDMKDGYYAPSCYEQYLSVFFMIDQIFYPEDSTRRGYYLDSPVSCRIYTTSSPFDESATIYIEPYGSVRTIFYHFVIEPDTDYLTVKLFGSLPEGTGDDFYVDTYEDFIEVFPFYLQLADTMTESGMLTPEDDFRFLIERAQTAFLEREILVEYPE